jgi:putative ABC transport system permease protein
MPLFSPDRVPIEIEGRGREETVQVASRAISPDYFALFDIPLRRGRYFTGSDDEKSPRVAIINEQAAQLFWPNGDVLSRRIRCGEGGWMTIIGVAANVRSLGLRRPPVPEIFVPFAQQPTARVSLALQVEGDPVASIPALYELAETAQSRAMVTYANSMSTLLDEQFVLVRALSTFGGVFAVIAMLLAGTGLYGAISCLYAQRAKEIGIRVALGADPRGILCMVAGSGAKLAGIGCLAGVMAGAAVSRLFQAAVFGIGSVDALVLAAAVTVTALVAVGATYAPAKRAANIAPAAAIRCE